MRSAEGWAIERRRSFACHLTCIVHRFFFVRRGANLLSGGGGKQIIVATVTAQDDISAVLSF